jgi:hypothetical protein
MSGTNSADNNNVCVWDAFGAFWCEGGGAAAGVPKTPVVAAAPSSLMFEGFATEAKSAALRANAPPKPHTEKKAPVPSAEGFCGCMLP